MSLTTFTHSCTCSPPADDDAGTIHCSCTVKNTGELAGDEVVLVYDTLSDAVREAVGASHPVPIRRLVDFERVSVSAGSSATVAFAIPRTKFALTTSDGSKKMYGGTHELLFSRGNGDDVKVNVIV
eukprot:COSAG02_NODE_4249_length_5586_cov_14.082377_2_plen_126_part_00